MDGKDNNTNNQLLRSLLESFSEPVSVVDVEFNYILFNKALIEAMRLMYGFDVKIGHNLTEYLSPDEYRIVKAYLDRALHGETVIINSVLGTKNVRYFEIIHKPYFDDTTNEIIGVFIFAKDITELQQLEQDKILNEKRLECLVNITNCGIKNIQQFVDFSLNEALSLTVSRFGYIYFYDEEKKEFTLNSWSDAVMHSCIVNNPQSVYQLEKTGIWGEAVRQRKPILLNDFQAPQPMKKGLPEGHADLNRFLTIPVFADDKIVAVVGVANKETDYSDSDIKHLSLMMNSVWKIVARMQAEEALKISEGLHENVLNNAIDGFFTIANDYSFLMVNDAFCKMVGYSREELLCLSVSDFDQDKDNVDVHKENIFKNGIDCFETKYKCKNESIIDVEIRLSFLRDNHLAFGFIRDISQKKRDELSLLNSQKRFKIMYENAPLSYQSLSSTAQFLDVNKAWLKTLGYERDEVIGHYFPEFLTPESAELVRIRFPNFMENGEIHDYIFEMVRKDGAIISVSYNGNIGYDEFGSFKQTHCIFQDITEKLKVEKRIIESEKKFRNIFESTVVGISITSIDGDLNVNDAFCEIVGYTKDELNVSNWTSITYKDDIDENERRVRLILDGHEKSQRWVKRYIHKNGNIVWVDVNTALHRDESGKPEYFITAVSDITDRKENELKLIESEERYRSLFHSNYSVMMIIDPDTGSILDANPAACEFYGWSYEQICQKKIVDINTLPRDQVFENMQEAKRSKRKQFQFTHRKSDGSLSDVEVYGTALKLDNKTVLHVIIHDITERKLALNSLAESERRFRDLLSNVHLISIILDLNGKIVFCNDYLLNLTQWKLDEVIGQHWIDIFISTDTKDEVKKLFKNSVDDNEVVIHYENSIIAKDGTEFIISWNNTSLYNEAGKINGIASMGVNVTEQRVAFASLQSAKDRLNRAELATKSGNWELHLDTGLIKTSQGARLVYGLAMGDNEYSDIVNFPLIEYRHILDKAMDDLINHNKPYDIEFKILAEKSGLIKDIHSTAVYEKSARIVFGVITDITERKIAEQALVDSEDQLKLVLRASKLGFWDWNLLTNTVDRNERWAEMLGYTLEEIELTVDRWSSLIHPDDKEVALKSLENHLAGVTALHSEIYRMHSKDGEWKWIHDRAQIVSYDINGKPLRMCGTHEDISETKKIELALLENERKLSALFSSMAEIVVVHELVFDEHGKPVNYKVLDCNKAFVNTIGIARTDAVGNLATDIFNTNEPPYFNEYVDVCTTGHSLDFKIYYKPLDKHFMISAVCLGNNQFATITADITEIVKSKEEIIAKNKELENYIYVASHDLRSPLVNIQGFSQRLSKQSTHLNEILSTCELDDSIRSEIDILSNNSIPKSLNFILTNVTKMDKLINGLLQVSRTGRLALIVKEVDAKDLIQIILMTSSFQLNEVGAKVLVSELDNCFGDEGQLNQLFSNLISNSIKYRSEQRALVIEISSEKKYRKVIYKIKDNGIGINARHADKVWDVFFRVNSNSSIEGDGLGLSLTKRIVDKHKGRIWLESEEGVGTTFFVELNNSVFTEN